MALQKQQVNVNFSKGLDTKSDPWQVPIGNFLNLENSVFSKIGRLEKRNGFEQIGSLPNQNISGIATFKDQLTLLGNNLYAFQEPETFLNRGPYKPANLSTQSIINNVYNHTQADSVVANDLICVVYTEATNLLVNSYKYAVLNAKTGQVVLSPSAIPFTGVGSVNGSPRVFVFNNNFVILYSVDIAGSDQLQYFRIPVNNLVPTAASVVSTDFLYSTEGSFDAVVGGNNLFIGWARAGAGGVYGAIMDSSFIVGTPVIVDATATPSVMSLSFDADPNFNNVSFVYYDDTTFTGRISVRSLSLGSVLAPTQWIVASAVTDVVNVTCRSQSGINTIIYEQEAYYSYTPTVPTHITTKIDVTTAGVVGASTVLARGNGLGSKVFVVDDIPYVVTTHQSPLQDSYFVMDLSSNVISTISYTEGDGYVRRGLCNVTVQNNEAQFCFLKKTSSQSGQSGIAESAAIYQAKILINNVSVYHTEFGNNLNLSGGFLWSYDGFKAVENNFFLYPENVFGTQSNTVSGAMTAQTYRYVAVYAWIDNQGNLFRSAPSEPFEITVTAPNDTVTLNVPNLRISYKTDVIIELYRFSQGEQIYHLIGAIINNSLANSSSFVDVAADSSIISAPILYTNGGILPNYPGPACSAMTIFDNRLWIVDSEEPDTIWYSKIVIPGTPVEMSGFQTFYVSPTQSAQGTTGKVTALAPMDDKLIVFKEDAIYYINGVGPDATGANSQYSEPIFITSTVGCRFPKSIVFIPNGLLFQSDKGIWLLGRDLSTSYIGAPVEAFTENAETITSLNIPNTNQVRFVLDSGNTLMYDYFFQQWGNFTGIGCIAATLYQQFHTYFDRFGRLFKELPGSYKDGANPVEMKFKTNWFALAGIQGFQRAYFLFILGQYLSPHKLYINVFYDFNPYATQQLTLTPENYAAVFGGDSIYGSSFFYGGPTQVEKWRLMLQKQKCDSVQFEFIEKYDSDFGVSPGAGLTLSGLNFIVGVKKGYGPISQFNTAG